MATPNYDEVDDFDNGGKFTIYCLAKLYDSSAVSVRSIPHRYLVYAHDNPFELDTRSE